MISVFVLVEILCNVTNYPALICAGGDCSGGRVCDGCKKLPAESMLKVTKRGGPLFLHRKVSK
jgi:hypothetical protein